MRLFFFFFKVGQDQSTVAQRAERTVAECSLTSACALIFLIDSVKGVTCLGVTCRLHTLDRMAGVFYVSLR